MARGSESVSNDILSQAKFLPETEPLTAINDYSHTLSGAQIGSLTQQASAVNFKAIVVVLPDDFSPPSFEDFAVALAKKWALSGREVLLLVDTKSHKVFAMGGSPLNAAGVSSEYLQQIILQREFIPYAAKGDLGGAISHTLAAVDSALAHPRAGFTAFGGILRGWPPAGSQLVSCALLAALAAVIVVALVVWRRRARRR